MPPPAPATPNHSVCRPPTGRQPVRFASAPPPPRRHPEPFRLQTPTGRQPAQMVAVRAAISVLSSAATAFGRLTIWRRA